MKIPWSELSDTALQGLIEEFVTRDGTDYGEKEIALQARVNRVRQQLREGLVEIVYDGETESATIRMTDA